MTVEEGIKFGFKIFKEILGDKFNPQRFNVAYIKNSEERYKRLTDEELNEYK